MEQSRIVDTLEMYHVPQNGGNGLVLDLLRSKRVLLIGRGVHTAKRRKQTCVRALRSKRGSCSSGWVCHTVKRDSTGYCSSLPSTSSSLHRLLFIHHRPPLASTCDCSSTGSCSSSLHRSSTGYSSTSLLHGVLFNHPSTGYCSSSPPPATVQPSLHGVLFIQPSTGSCSSSPPRGPVHPLPTDSIDRGPVHPATTPRGPVHPTPHRELFIQTPQQRSLFIQRQHRSASVSSSSEGIARSGSVKSHRSITRVQ